MKYVITRVNGEGLIDYGLCDWAGPFDYEDLEGAPTPRAFTDTLLYIKFLKICIWASEILGEESGETEVELERIGRIFKNQYMNEDGSCRIEEQTAIAMLIYLDFYDDIQPLKAQLEKAVREKEFHLHVGMVGMRYLLHALSKCNLDEYAYRIMTSTGYPSYSEWVKRGATTMWETFQCTHSRDHHMYSDVISWFVKNILGIKPVIDGAGYQRMEISPFFFQDISYAKGSYDTKQGRIVVDWVKKEGEVKFQLTVPEGVQVYLSFKNAKPYEPQYNGRLNAGQYTIKLYMCDSDDRQTEKRDTFL